MMVSMDINNWNAREFTSLIMSTTVPFTVLSTLHTRRSPRYTRFPREAQYEWTVSGVKFHTSGSVILTLVLGTPLILSM